MTQNLSSLYMPVAAQAVGVQGSLLLQAWRPGRGRHPVGGLFAAREAARTQLRAVWHRRNWKKKSRPRPGLIFGWGLVALVLAGVGAYGKITDGPPWPGFVAAFLILLAFALFTPLSARLLGAGPAAGFPENPGTRGATWAAAICRVFEPQRGVHRRPGLRPGDAHRGDGDDRFLPADGE